MITPRQALVLRHLIEDYRDAEVARAEAQFASNTAEQMAALVVHANIARNSLDAYLASLAAKEST